MRYFICTAIFCLATGVSFAQGHIKVGLQANHIPSFKVNSTVHNQSSSEGVRLTVSDFNKYSFELGVHLTRGYDSSVNFSYGLFLAGAFLETERHRFQAGLDISRFVILHYKQQTD